MNLHKKMLYIISNADDYLQFFVGFILLVIAAVLTWQTLIAIPGMFSVDYYLDDTLIVIHDVMLIMIILELLWTIITYLREHTIPLEPFLFVGIISSIRKMLLIGAQMSLHEDIERLEAAKFQLNELAVHGGLIFIMIVSLVLIRWSKTWALRDEISVDKYDKLAKETGQDTI